MINVQVHINYSYLKELFEAVAKEIKTNVEKLAQPNFVGEELETVEVFVAELLRYSF